MRFRIFDRFDANMNWHKHSQSTNGNQWQYNIHFVNSYLWKNGLKRRETNLRSTS